MTPRTPSAAKPRVVLATLLVQCNNVVSTHTLIDELWSSGPPRTAATTLQVYVSQLRKALLEEAGPDPEQPLVTRPPGYAIRVADDELDLTVFERLRALGRTAYENGAWEESSVLLERALGLWTGSALSGIPQGPSLETSAIRLDELRSEVLEQRITADLKLGRHQELIGELMALAHEHPLREALHGRLMVALYRSGRQSEALQAYHGARHALKEELGVEPGPGLNRLLERILASDPSLAWQEQPPPVGEVGAGRQRAVPPAPGPAVWLPPAVAGFAGRGEELAAGAAVLAAEPSPAGRVLAVSGRAGTGKTALAVQLAHRSAALFPDGRILLPFRDASGRALTREAAMRVLLRRLGSPADTASPAEDLPEALHDAVRGRGLLVIMDDVASEAQVRPLLSALSRSTVILTSVQRLPALEGTDHLLLDVLSAPDAEAMLRTSGGPATAGDPGAVAEIARLCGGLPLALRVAAAGLAARPHWTASRLAERLRDERTRLSALTLGDLDVRAALLAPYRRLGPELGHAFRMLASAPRAGFGLRSVAALLDVEVPRAERYAEELVRRQLLEVRPPGDGAGPVRYGFPPLVRSLALEVLADEDARAVGEAVERLGRDLLAGARRADALLAPGRDRSAARADPVAEAGRGVPPEEGDAPLRWFQEEAGGLLESVRRAHAAGQRQLCCALAAASAGYYEACALWDDWLTSHRLALDAARRAHDPHAEAVVLSSLGDLAWQRRHAARALDHYRRARRLFSRCEDRAGAARCLTGEADVLLGQGRPVQARRGYEAALAGGRAEDDARGCAEALRGLALVALYEGREKVALERLTGSAAEAVRLGDLRLQEYARRTAEGILAARHRGSGTPLEVRPGVWLIRQPVLAGAGAS
ncbi:NB-ARC domain-containing protein [Streptomyces sp. NBC_01754]|uniref:AfsR/SARP family transcriptional regulator n=1 Tax=Streptomyces sp. NBC_01754 TaxID=2975930 RepID=UPI002DDAB94E|nr:BTAD domain-containing putative transcriptional regulator [Streptomyces sp. NBC_01754]WSC95544.1 NB-ARC domain-containing protein [Streptomyces sp. NBC_01754]